MAETFFKRMIFFFYHHQFWMTIWYSHPIRFSLPNLYLSQMVYIYYGNWVQRPTYLVAIGVLKQLKQTITEYNQIRCRNCGD